MRTKGDAIVDVASQAYAEAVAISGRDHTPRELSSFLKDVGAEVELFLRDAVYGGKRRGWSFEQLIDGLVPLGASQQIAAELHALRKAYNAAKHDPAYQAPIAEVLEVLQAAVDALRSLLPLGIGGTNVAAPLTYRRLFWLAGWDYFASGVTEVAVMLPTADDAFPPVFDSIHLSCSGWTAVTDHFAAAGQLRLGRSTVPDHVYDRWRGEGDLAEGGSFDGDYRELVTMLAAHAAPAEREGQLLSNLLRENDRRAMLNAFFMATVDVSQAGITTQNVAELAERIAVEAAHRYAAPRHAPVSRDVSPKLARLVLALPPAQANAITGPYWVSRASFEAALPTASATFDGKALIAADGRLLVEL
jgi:hypothetical protein